MTTRLDQWACTYSGPSAIPGRNKLFASVCRGMADIDGAKLYADKVAKFFAAQGCDESVFVVRGPTSTTKTAFEVTDACAGYSVVYRVRSFPTTPPTV